MATGAKEQGDAQVPPTRETGAGSATGTALEQQDHEIPSGDDRGSKTEIVGGDPKPDIESPKATGAQLEPARFTSNGQIPHNTVPSPTGSVPVGATGLSVDDAQAKVDEVNAAHDAQVASRNSAAQRISPATISRLHGSELRAIADQRGYDMTGATGGRSTREAFIKAQDADKTLETPKPRAKKTARKSTKKSGTKRRS